MKKVLLMIACMLIAINSFSQSSHIEFKGIPLDGQLSDFVSKLQKQGFTFNKYLRDYVVIMEGVFAGKYATIYVLATPKSKIVWKVSANYDEKESWSSLKSDYSDMKELYTKKYGDPNEHFEFFSKPYYEGDGYELQALKKEKCTYISFYNIPFGNISVEITKFCKIQLSYEDEFNYKLKEKEEESSVLNDI